MKSISLVDECIEKFIKGGLKKYSPHYYGKGAIKEMVESGLFMSDPVIALTEDGLERAEHLGLISAAKKQSMLVALERSGVELKRGSVSGGDAQQVA